MTPRTKKTDSEPSDPRVQAWDVARRKLEDLDDLVLDAINHDDVSEDWEQEAKNRMSEALAVARRERIRREREAVGEWVELIRLSEVAALSMKTLRTKAEMTQQQLAQTMQQLGFVGWKRITVAEIESLKRR